MTREINMTKEQMREGFARGKTLVQEEWSNALEIKWVDELIAEGVAAVSAPWEYLDSYQCERPPRNWCCGKRARGGNEHDLHHIR